MKPRKPKRLIFRYLVHGKPIPKGWRLAHDLRDTKHGAFAVLIEKVKV